MDSSILKYVRIVMALVIVYFLGSQTPHLFEFFHGSIDAHLLTGFFTISLICVLSFCVFYLSAGTKLPSFVVAIFFGLAAKPLLGTIIGTPAVLGEIVGFGATLILFGGGLETPWENFKKLIGRILSLSLIGLGVTAFLLSLIIGWIGVLFGVHIPIAVAVLLGAVLASTDPASIIPILKQFRFHNRDTKDLIISESAVTDVSGTLLTVILLSFVSAGTVFTSVINGYGQLFTNETLIVLLKQIGFGVVFGVVGFALLETLARFKRRHAQEFEADAAYFLFVPVIIFTLALAFGGSGYLAAFIAGLLFVLSEHLHVTEKFFNQTIEGFLKPTIFLLLGALVDVHSLIEYAGIGIIASLAFMFVIRPLTVFLTLGPFSFFGKDRLGWRELLFISFVRETGAIPAVLLVTIVASGANGLDGLVPIGMWVILGTLILEPPLTPLVAKILNVAKPISDEDTLHISGNNGPYVVLESRGDSYLRRLPHVAEWASVHGIKNVVLLHCLEDRYTKESAKEKEIQAESEFARINKERELRGKLPIQFSFVSRKGFLQQNIQELAQTDPNVTMFFVGKKVLDYRLDEIKALSVPFYFMD